MAIKWTEDKIARLRELREDLHSQDIANILSEEWGEKVTNVAIKETCKRYNLPPSKLSGVNRGKTAWTPGKLAEMKKLIEEGKTIKEAAKRLGVTTCIIQGTLNNHGMSLGDIWREGCEKIYDDFLELPEDDYLICCDFHAPFHSFEWLRRLDATRKKQGIKNCIIAGDLFDMNFAKHWQNFEGEKGTSLESEKEAVAPLLNVLKQFDKIYLIRGNHESRVTRQTSIIQANVVIDYYSRDVFDKGQFKYNKYSHCFIGNDWMAVHPQSYSQISGSVAVRLAEKYHKNILNAHGHFVSLRYDRSGKYKCVDVGAMVDPQKIAYKNLSITTHPEWNNGFVTLIRGELQMYNDMTIWGMEEWKNEKLSN